MDKKLVSIIIPVYNGSNKIAEALNSVINQTYKDIEIIVINDGSTDDGKTKDAVAPFLSDERVSYFEKDNEGPAKTINFGISKASGEFITFLTHDALMESTSIEKRIKYWNKLGQNPKTIIYTNTAYIDYKGDAVIKSRVKIKELKSISDILTSSVDGCSLLFNKNVFKKHSFRDSVEALQDYFLWANLINEGYSFKLLNKKLSIRRFQSNQISTIKYNLRKEYFTEFANKYIDPLFDTLRIKEIKDIVFYLAGKVSIYPFYQEFILKYINKLMMLNCWKGNDISKLQNKTALSWFRGKRLKPIPMSEPNNILKNMLLINIEPDFNDFDLWNNFVNKYPDVNFTYLVNETKTDVSLPGYVRCVSDYKDDEISELFKNTDIVIYKSNCNENIENVLTKAKHLVVISDELSKKKINLNAFFNKTHSNWRTMNRYLLATSYYAYKDFEKYGFKDNVFKYGVIKNVSKVNASKHENLIVEIGDNLSLKKIKDAIFAVKILNKHGLNYRLEILGNNNVSETLNYIKKHKMEDYVKVLSGLDHKEILEKINVAAITLHNPDDNIDSNGDLIEALLQNTVVFADTNVTNTNYVANKKNSFIFNNRKTLKKKLLIFKNLKESSKHKITNFANDEMANVWSVNSVTTRLFEWFTSIVRKEINFVKYDDGPISKHKIIRKKKMSEETDLSKIEHKGKSNMLIGSLFGYLTIAMGVISGLVLIPWIIGSVGADAYGIYGLATSLLSIFILDSALSTTTNTYLSKLRAKNDKDGVERFLATIFKLYLLLDLILVVVIAVFYFAAADIFISYTPEQIDLLKKVLLICGGYSIINFPCTSFSGALSSYEKFGFIKFSEFCNKVLYFILTVLAIKCEWGLIGLVTVNAISGIAAIIMRFLYLRIHLGIHLRITAKLDTRAVKDIFRFSGWALVMTIGSRLVLNITPTILGIVSPSGTGAEQSGMYSVVSTIEMYIFSIGSIISTFFMAKIARTEKEDGESRKIHLQNLANRVGKIQFILITLIMIGWVTVGKEFLTFWLPADSDPKFVPTVYWGIIAICGSEIINLPEIFLQQAMYAEGRIKPVAIVSLIKAGVNLALSFWLSKEYGAMGACMAIAVARVVALVLNNVVYSKYLDIKLSSFFKNIYIRGSITIVLSLGIGVLLHMFVPLGEKLKFLVDGFGIVIVYTLCTLFITLNCQERVQYVDGIKRFVFKNKYKAVEKIPHEKKRILTFVGKMEGGGVEAFTMNYFRKLHDKYEFTFVCFDNSTKIPTEEITALGGKIVIVPHVKKYIKFNKQFRKIVKEGEFDIIHSHINTLSVFPLRIAFAYSVPVRISHSHSTTSNKEFVRNIIKNILKKFSKLYATKYCACSEAAGRFQFGNKAFDNNEVQLIRNGIDINKFAFNESYRNEIRDELKINKDAYVVGNFGRLCKTKNQSYLISLAELDPAITYLIIGSGELKDKLQNTIKEKKLNNVILLGNTSDIYKYYSAIDVFALPSLYEGLGLCVVEAQANGLYSVVSDKAPLECLPSKHGKFIPIGKNDINEWINEIKKKNDRKDCKSHLIKAGFDSAYTSEQLEKLYNN